MSKIYDALRKAERDRGRGRPKRAKKAKAPGTALKSREAVLFSGFDEDFRRSLQTLRSAIDTEIRQVESRIIMITSAVKGEGKTTIVATLGRAMALGESDRILLVDCSVSSPELHEPFGLQNEKGMLDYLEGNAEFKDIIRSIDPDVLDVITAGILRDISHAQPLFNSDRMEQFIKEAGERYDYVLIDTAAVLEAPETAILGSYVSGSILIINSGRTKREVIKRAMLMIEKLDGKFIGTVLNRKKYYIPEFLYKRI